MGVIDKMVELGRIKSYIAMIGIVVLEAYALFLGIDGVALAGVVAALAGLGGYELGKRQEP